MSDKETNLKEKLRQALASTIRVISDDLEIKQTKDNKSSNKFDFFELDNLNSKIDFIKARAEADSSALKENFLAMKSIKKIFQITRVVNHYMQLQKKLDTKR
jgi:cobaltochelatase CobT